MVAGREDKNFPAPQQKFYRYYKWFRRNQLIQEDGRRLPAKGKYPLITLSKVPDVRSAHRGDEDKSKEYLNSMASLVVR